MDSQWQQELLALVTRYGDACAQLAAERERGRAENPPADRSGAWRAILTHISCACGDSAGAPVRRIVGH
jgi:hypothetical protein